MSAPRRPASASSRRLFDKIDIHVHVPEGATPKDGPSAGLAMATSIISVITGIPIRRDVAMTGEVTLRGRALPIGGLKEKLLAALRAGITTVIIPKENEKDLAEVPDNVKTGLKIVPVSNVGEVLKVALVRQPEAIDWVEPEVPVVPRVAAGRGRSRSAGHPLNRPEIDRGPELQRPGPSFLAANSGGKNPPEFRAFSPSGQASESADRVRVLEPQRDESREKEPSREQERSHPEAGRHIPACPRMTPPRRWMACST